MHKLSSVGPQVGFTQWLMLALRTEEHESIKLMAWSTLEMVARKISLEAPSSETISAWAMVRDRD